MARQEDWEFGGDDFWETPEPAPELNDILFSRDASDPYAQELMFDAMVKGDSDAYARLTDYMWDEYGIDFEDAWDWQDFAEWYESQ